MLLTLMAGAAARGADNASSSPITIGGVVYMDVHDPIRTGLQGVAVQVQGDQGHFEAVTAGILGLWKMDVPPGTYTVTPAKSGYSMEHLVRGWCDGQRSITIEANPKNLAANQSIQFLAVYWPEPNAPTATNQERVEGVPLSQRGQDARDTAQPAPAPPASVETPPPQRTGGGCAAAPGRRGDAGAFFAPYAACVGGLLITSRIRVSKRVRDTWHRHPADAAWAGSPCHKEPASPAPSERPPARAPCLRFCVDVFRLKSKTCLRSVSMAPTTGAISSTDPPRRGFATRKRNRFHRR
jgi:hypothetical protein